MNYVSHTRAANERLLAQPAARPQHISLYWALFFQWNAQRFPNGLDLDHAATQQAARIGNERTYRATLYDLDTWGLLAYQPSQSRYQPSRCFLLNLSGAKVPDVEDSTEGTSAPYKQPAPGAEVPEGTLLYKTPCSVNVCAAEPQKKMRGRVFEGEGLSEVQLLDDHAAPDGAGPPQATAPQKKVAPKKRGSDSQAATIRAAATAPSPARRAAPLPELPFSQSPIASAEAFAEAFAGTDYALADLRHYHQLVATWRDKKTGYPPLRKDWIATAKRFMLNDAADNRLKLAPGNAAVAAPGADGSPPTTGIPTTGYRSSRWD